MLDRASRMQPAENHHVDQSGQWSRHLLGDRWTRGRAARLGARLVGRPSELGARGAGSLALVPRSHLRPARPQSKRAPRRTRQRSGRCCRSRCALGRAPAHSSTRRGQFVWRFHRLAPSGCTSLLTTSRCAGGGLDKSQAAAAGGVIRTGETKTDSLLSEWVRSSARSPGRSESAGRFQRRRAFEHFADTRQGIPQAQEKNACPSISRGSVTRPKRGHGW
jgi:hypothetical protein